MIKFIISIISGVVIGVSATLYTINWQEEKLTYEIGEIAQFGEITYQNIKIKNTGWNPAEHVKIQVNSEHVKSENVKASPPFNIKADKLIIGGFDRIRRDEVVTVSLAFNGPPISPSSLSIKSDRSIALNESMKRDNSPIDWAFVVFVMTVASFVIGLVSAIVIPAYRDYKNRALEAQARKAAE